MIIDLILDRYHGDAYDPKAFYEACMDYEEGTGYPISRALDSGEESDVKKALCDYIDGEYNPKIKDFINAVEWLEADDGHDYSKEIVIEGVQKPEERAKVTEAHQKDILYYIPAHKEFFKIQPGSGDALEDEDREAGYVDYFLYSTFKPEDLGIDDELPMVALDSGMFMVKEEGLPTEKVAADIVDYHYGEKTDFVDLVSSDDLSEGLKTLTAAPADESAYNPGNEDWAFNADFSKFKADAGKLVTILALAGYDRVYMLLTDYVGSGTVLIGRGDSTVIPMESPYNAEDICEDLRKAGIDYCVYTQALDFAK